MSARSSTLLMLVGIRTLHHCVDDHLTAIKSNVLILPIMSIFFIQTYYSINIQLSVYCLETFSQTCCSITLADSQAFY